VSKHHCSRCGKRIEGKKYDPYNVTFNHYAFKRDNRIGEGQYCFKCAEIFIKGSNKCLGGHWVIEKTQD